MQLLYLGTIQLCQWRSVDGAAPPPVRTVVGQGGCNGPSLFTKIGDPSFLQNMKFNVKKRKVMKVLKNSEGLKTVIDA